jgi:hypothetical protein
VSPREAGIRRLSNASSTSPEWGAQSERIAPALESAVHATRASALTSHAAHEIGTSDSSTASSDSAAGAK